MKTQGGSVLLVVVISVALAAVFRCWMLDFGLPWKPYPDEYAYVRKAFGMCANGDLNPHLFLSPPVWTYSLVPTFGAYYVVSRSTSVVQSPRDFREQVHRDPTALYLLARLQAVAMSLLVLWSIWGLARHLAGPTAAALAVFSFAIGFLGVREAHFAVNDTALTLVVALILYATVCGYRRLTLVRLAVLGLLVGLATGIKYNGVLIAPTVALGVVLSPQFRRPRQMVKGISFAAAVTILGFTLVCPWWLLDARTFFADALGQMRMGSAPWSEQPLLPTWRLMGETIRMQMGIPGLAAAVGGAIILFRRDRRTAALVVSFLAVYGAALVTSRLFYPRFVLPVIPVLAVLLGIGGQAATEFLGRRLSRPVGRLIVPVILLAGPFAVTLQGLSLLATTDTRISALQWVQAHLPPGSTLLDLGADLPLESIMAEPKRVVRTGGLAVSRRSSLACTAGDWATIEEELRRSDHVAISDNIWARHLGDGSMPPSTRAILRYLADHGELVAEFSPYKRGGSAYQNGLCEPDIPFYEVKRRYRIGNHLRIYRLVGESFDELKRAAGQK